MLLSIQMWEEETGKKIRVEKEKEKVAGEGRKRETGAGAQDKRERERREGDQPEEGRKKRSKRRRRESSILSVFTASSLLPRLMNAAAASCGNGRLKQQKELCWRRK
ncbi:hypothetical protein CFOL_v3_13681 [Cephalotus follicularis]|uniref:Uncharacterized protein n=1 Tax=Cephalotus follicularis TaxID=3775 RepID=A0A1Q3BR46_CEPFO|nr:hypothetical protein CFOL_v3_13681 [Cephalotus follicularis]